MTESLTQRERQIKKLLESIKSYRLTDSELKMMKRAQLQMEQSIQNKFRASEPNRNYRFPFIQDNDFVSQNSQNQKENFQENQRDLISEDQLDLNVLQIHKNSSRSSKKIKKTEDVGQKKSNKKQFSIEKKQICQQQHKGKQQQININLNFLNKKHCNNDQPQIENQTQNKMNKKNCSENNCHLRLSLKVNRKKKTGQEVQLSQRQTESKLRLLNFKDQCSIIHQSSQIQQSNLKKDPLLMSDLLNLKKDYLKVQVVKNQAEGDQSGIKSKLKIKKLNNNLNLNLNGCSTSNKNQILRTENNINSKSYFQYTYEGKINQNQKKLNYFAKKYEGYNHNITNAKNYVKNHNLNKNQNKQNQQEVNQQKNQENINFQSFCSNNQQNMDQNVCLNICYKKYGVQDLKSKIRQQSQQKKQIKTHKRISTEGKQIKIRLFQNSKHDKSIKMKTEMNQVELNKTPDNKYLNRKGLKQIVSSNKYLNKTLNCLKGDNKMQRTLSTYNNKNTKNRSQKSEQKTGTLKVAKTRQNKQNSGMRPRMKDNKINKSHSSTRITSILQSIKQKDGNYKIC